MEVSRVNERLRVAAAQLNARIGDVRSNLKRVREILSEQRNADLVVFPELCLCGYTVEGLGDLAVDLHGPEVRSIADAAREWSTSVIIGFAERTDRGIANSAVFIDRQGNVAGVHRKLQMYGAEGEAFVPGDELRLLEVCGLRMGLLICFDMDFPEMPRALARAGANMLVTISANMEPFGNDHAVFCSARAIENGITHVYVNQVGPGKGLTFTGGSMVVSSDGEVLASAGSSSERILQCELHFPQTSSVRPRYLEELRSPIPTVGAPSRVERSEGVRQTELSR